nr:MFS transporter [Clostridia bacterium]
MDFIRQYKGLDREIYYLAAIRCINAIGRMFVFPYTSLLLAEFVGLSPVQIGYYMLIRSIVNAISHAVGGKLSDHFSRKKVIIISYILEIVSMILAAAFFRSTLLMLMLLVGGGIANVPLPAISALTLDKCPRAVRTESLSLLYLSSNIGSAVGPLIAGL